MPLFLGAMCRSHPTRCCSSKTSFLPPGPVGHRPRGERASVPGTAKKNKQYKEKGKFDLRIGEAALQWAHAELLTVALDLAVARPRWR